MTDLEPRINVGKIVAKGAISTLPVIGGLINEIVMELIPDRRIERLNSLLVRLEERVARMETVPPRDRWAEPVFVDLLEDGFREAARASSSERLDHIAAILADGLSADRARNSERKFLLNLLGQLNDVEVLLLAAKGEETNTARQAFYAKHGDAIERPHPTFGGPESELERAAIFHGYDRHLETLGLLDVEVPLSVKKSEPPRIERNGRPKGTRLTISSLGRALLRAIGEPSELDRGTRSR